MASCEHAVQKNSPILVTGSAGFIGRNLLARLGALGYTNLLCYDMGTKETLLEEYAAKASFVFHLAGVNRPKDAGEFYTGNSDLTGRLMNALEAAGNKAPVVLSSSAQAGNGTDYAKSKEAAEERVHTHGKEHGGKVYVYRLPGVFGKWCRPGYNSVVATFCYNVARGEAIEVRDESYSLPLCYIDDVVDSFLSNMKADSTPPPSGHTLGITPTYEITLGKLAKTIRGFKKSREDLSVPVMTDALTAKLYATYLSCIPQQALSYPLTMNTDERGSFTEFLRTKHHGQVSVNITKPGVTKGNHWHDTKNEKFLVVSGRGVIRFRVLGSEEVTEYLVSGERLEVLDIPTGATHNIENVGDTDLVTVMWASEPFNPDKPDTWFEKV